MLKTAAIISEEEEATKEVSEAEKQLLKLFEAYKALHEAPKEVEKPSSVMLQILKYGKTFKRVVEHVEYDISEFDKVLKKVMARSDVINLSKNFYGPKWTTPDVRVPKEDVESLLDPLNGQGLGDFTFKQDLNYNEKFHEAIDAYVARGKVMGKVVFDEARNRLVVMSSVVSGHSLGLYYQLFILEPEGNEVKTYFLCSCPWALGHTHDRRGKPIPPEATSLCKHGIATLFYFYPEIAAYVKLASEGRLSKEEFGKLVPEVRKAFDEVQKRVEEYVNRNPDARGVVISNVAYAITRELYKKFHELGSPKKLLPDDPTLSLMPELWDGVKVVRKETITSTDMTQPSSGGAKKITHVLTKLEELKIYDRLSLLEELLNGLQGSRISTLYTKALLAGLVLGSDLETDPVLVSVVGDPGTGKTLTAEGLARLIGIRSLVIEKDVEASVVKEEAREVVKENLKRFQEFFEKVVEPKVPAERRDEARKFFEEYLDKASSLASEGNTKTLIKLSKQFAETFSTLYGVKSGELKLNIAKLFYSIAKFYRKVYETYMSSEVVERRALEERRKLLELVAKYGLITRPEAKEEMNSGSVRWEIQETAKGYKIRVILDLHYVLRKFNGDIMKLMDAVKEFEKAGNVFIKTEVPGLAELKLSEAEYLEKALRVREEDILSPAKRLIWVGGELTKKSLILIDESRRAPELLERLLTDLSTAGRDTRRTNLVATTDNAEPLMEAESDPRLDAFHSRVNFEVVTPSTTVSYIISETLNKISELERKGSLPLVTLDEMLLLNFLSNDVKLPERYETVLYAIPLLLVYDFKILRPEVVSTLYNASRTDIMFAPPLVLPIPKGAIDILNIQGDYQDSSWGVELPAIRMMPERRFGHHVVRAGKALAIIHRSNEVDEETFLSALEMVLMARVMPAERRFPYLYIDAKRTVVDTFISKVREFLSRPETATERLIEVLGSLSVPSPETLTEALEEMINNPVATAIFIRFVEQMLVSEHSKEFVELATKVPGLYKTIELVARFEKIRVPV